MVAGTGHLVSQKAQTLLRSSERYALRQLEVEMTPQGLVISGQVESFYLKQQAQETIRAVVRDIPLINQIDVV